jgi:outer membrane protein assembly factor BamB
VIQSDTVVAVTDEQVVALFAETGDVRWEVAREPGPAGPAAIDGERVVYAEGAGRGGAVVAVSLEDGEEAWRLDTESPVVGGVTVADDLAFIGGRDGTVRAIDLDSGDERWSFDASGRVETPAAMADGLVVFVAEAFKTGRATAYALDATTGEEEWSFSPEDVALGASPAAVGDDLVVFGLGDLRVRALELDTGRERWSARSRAPFSARAAPAFAGDVLIGDRVGHLYRFDPASGEEGWVFRVPGSFLAGSPVVIGTFVVVGDWSGQVSAIDMETGHLVWKDATSEGAILGIAAAGERILVSSADGSVKALEHDPRGALLDEASPTTLFVGRAVLNFVAAVVPLMLVLLLLFRWVGRRPGPRFSENPAPGGDT